MSRYFAPLPLLVVILASAPGGVPPAAAASADVCSVTADTLDEARRDYADRCTLVRVDCDPIDGRWTCSSERIGRAAPGRPAVLPVTDPAPSPVTPPPVEPVVPSPVEPVTGGDGRQGGACEVSAPDLTVAKARYAERCSAPRVDCDPAEGEWTCASYRIGLAAPGRLPAAPAPGTPSVPDTPSTPSVPAAPTSDSLRVEAETATLNAFWRYTDDGIVYTGPNRFGASAREDDANLVYRVTVPSAGTYRFVMRSRATRGGNEPPNDVWVRFGDVAWIKAFTPKPAQAWSEATIGERSGSSRNRENLESSLSAGIVDVTISGRSSGHEIDRVELVRVGGSDPAPVPAPTPAPVPVSGTVNATYQSGDLLVLHHDSFPDPDDLQAIIANRQIIDREGVADVLVVNGTISHRNDRVIDGSLENARSLFGSGVIDARAGVGGDKRFSSDSTARVADRWEGALARGATVHVAEGGASDFTAGVLLELERRGVPGLERIRVVQHSAGTRPNEANTSDANIAAVKRISTYVAIDDGNSSNGTPNFKQESVALQRRALATKYASNWRYAFSRRAPGRPVPDFSDSVEVLHILGIPKSAAPDIEGFADRYFR